MTARIRARAAAGRKPGSSGRRSLPKLDTRHVVMLILGLALAFYSFQHTAGAVLSRTSPSQALLIDGDNMRALTKLGDTHFTQTRGEQPLPPDITSALRAGLLNQRLDRRGLRLLGLDAQLTGDGDRAAALMKASSSVSRRDPGAQIYMLREAALAGDWSGTMRHMDAAFSTRPQAREQLSPSLFQLLTNRELRENLIPLLKQERPWTLPFLRDAVETIDDLDALNALFREGAPLAGGQPLHEIQARMLARYAARGEISKADAFAREVLDVDREVLSEAGLNAATTAQIYAPLTWSIGVPDNVNVTTDGGQANIRVTSGPPASAMTRYFALPTGEFRLQWSLRRPQMTPLAEGAFVIQCPQGDRLAPIARRELGSREGRAAIDFTIPSNCDGVRIDLLAEGNVSGAMAEVSISNIRLTER